MDAIGHIGYQQFEQVGVEGFVRLLNDLEVCEEDMDTRHVWADLILDTIQSSEGIQHLSHSYWELLVKLIVHWGWGYQLRAGMYNPHIIISLQDAKEWDKLKCWICIVWIVWPEDSETQDDLEHVMLSLFHQQPAALQKLEEWMKQWSQVHWWHKIPNSFQQICKQGHDKVTQQNTL